nr:prolyl oligopeptidase family serine peptidase [Cytophagales bacterium]
MRTYCKISLSIILISMLVAPVWSQGALADYRRADSLKTAWKDKVYHSPTQIKWHESNVFTYVYRDDEGIHYVKVDPATATKSPLFDAVKLASVISEEMGEQIAAAELQLSQLEIQDSLLSFTYKGEKWEWEEITETLTKTEELGGRSSRYWGTRDSELDGPPVPSPDKTKEAFIRDYNVFVKDLSSGKSEQLTKYGYLGEYYTTNLKWSPDGEKLAVFMMRPAAVRKLTLIASAPEDQLQPKVTERDYVKPGDALPIRRPVIIDLESKKSWKVDLNLMPDQFSLNRLNWSKNSQSITWEYNQRSHQRYTVFEMDASTGNVREVIDERSNTFIDYSGKYYRKDLEDKNQIIWSSERDGWRHLYLIDASTGSVIRQLTQGEWVVRQILHVDEEAGMIYFTGSGKDPKEDPYHLHLYRVGLDGKGLTQLTRENANHEITLSKDGAYFIDHFSRQDLPPTTLLKSGNDGSVGMELEKASIDGLLAAGWKAPQIFTAKGRDGKTDIWGLIITPTNFDPTKKYPVIEYIYAGPHASFVPKSFSPNYYGLNELAELGFVVVQMDGMGTSNRSKAFHDVAWRNIGDAGFPDRIAWIKAAAKANPYMDLDRVGIFGTSAGGQSATGALLFHPDFYKVAVSSCGCHDNRMDKIWWNEQWMGFPSGDHYEKSSNVVNAGNLKGDLLLIVGEVDDNVDPSSTYQLVDQLIKHEKVFEFLMVPGMGHSSGGTYGERKRRDFFVKHLLGVEPPDWNKGACIVCAVD